MSKMLCKIMLDRVQLVVLQDFLKTISCQLPEIYILASFTPAPFSYCLFHV